MIILQDLLNLTDEERERAKVKFNIYNGQENPIDLFKANPDKVNNQGSSGTRSGSIFAWGKLLSAWCALAEINGCLRPPRRLRRI